MSLSAGAPHRPRVHKGADERLRRLEARVKPRLRGWFHAGMVPVVLLAGIALIVFGHSLTARLAAAVYLLSSLMLFGTSATYHRGTWNDRFEGIFRRWDHANIFVFIAGTYTPLAADLLHGHSRVLLLTVVWACALAGVCFRVLWLSAPRPLYTVLYVLMGWLAVGWLPAFWHAGGPAIVLLLLAGGLVYSAGALVYGARRPDPAPEWFGFHEIFHACTVVAAVCHYLAICLATFR